MNFPILTFITFIPLAGAVLLIFIRRDKENLIRYISLGIVLVAFVLSLFLYFNFNAETPEPKPRQLAPSSWQQCS